jgi:hypothetical protein
MGWMLPLAGEESAKERCCYPFLRKGSMLCRRLELNWRPRENPETHTCFIMPRELPVLDWCAVLSSTG